MFERLTFIQEMEGAMGQASVLTDTEMRRVLRIIETTRHAERNRLAFVLTQVFELVKSRHLQLATLSRTAERFVGRSSSGHIRRKARRVEQ
jgi:hypothetical protein